MDRFTDLPPESVIPFDDLVELPEGPYLHDLNHPSEA